MKAFDKIERDALIQLIEIYDDYVSDRDRKNPKAKFRLFWPSFSPAFFNLSKEVGDALRKIDYVIDRELDLQEAKRILRSLKKRRIAIG